jgi:hypothetical protein
MASGPGWRALVVHAAFAQVRADERRQDALGQERPRVHEPRSDGSTAVDPDHRLGR